MNELVLHPTAKIHKYVNANHISEIQPWFNFTYNLIMKED